MKNIDNGLVSSCFEYIQHDFSNLNKAIKPIKQVHLLSSEEKSLIDKIYMVTHSSKIESIYS